MRSKDRRYWWLACLLLWPLWAFASEDPVAAAAERIAAEAGAHRIVVIGEMHGTREAPAVMAALSERYAKEGPLLVALEVWRTEHAALSAYMSSDGGSSARGHVRAQPFWDRAPEENDGRRTEDMLDLLEALRRLRVGGYDVAVVPFDIGPDAFVDSAARSRDMATHLRTAFNALPRGRMVVLTGNVHAMLRPPQMLDDGRYRTATQLLADLEPFAVNLTAERGAAWVCSDTECGPMQLLSGLRTGANIGPYHFSYALPEYTVARLVGEE